jgi:uncharacterized protein YecT (DUF1311 family)
MKSNQCRHILVITLLFIVSLFISDCSNATAEGSTQSVQGRRIQQIQQILNGKKDAQGEEKWQKICKGHENVPLPATDKPTAEVAASLGKCSSYELYYGFNQPADPTKARLCAYDEIEKKREDGPFSGVDMLMTIYANGIGAKRNFPLAIKLACTIEGAPAETEYRVTHLERLKKENWRGNDFSLCDDITSGMMQGFCADHFERFAKLKRSKLMKDIQAKWSEAEKADYAVLRKATDQYINVRIENEIDESGTARGAILIEQQAAMEDEFINLIQDLQRGKLPLRTSVQFNASDAVLNTVYNKVQKSKDADLWGTVTKEGIKHTQRKWILYRDAWVVFCKKKYPKVESNSVKTRLTELRVEMLKLFE